MFDCSLLPKRKIYRVFEQFTRKLTVLHILLQNCIQSEICDAHNIDVYQISRSNIFMPCIQIIYLLFIYSPICPRANQDCFFDCIATITSVQIVTQHLEYHNTPLYSVHRYEQNQIKQNKSTLLLQNECNKKY